MTVFEGEKTLNQGQNETPYVSILIVNWNAGELLQRCIRAVKRSTRKLHSEIIIVDNASTDGSLKSIGKYWPDVSLLQNSGNYGFAVAANQGIRAVRGRYILLLNPDAIVDKNAIMQLCQFLDGHQAAAAVSAMLFNLDGEIEVGFGGYAPTLRHLANHYLFISKIFPGRKWSRGYFSRGKPSEVAKLDWVSGACVLLRRSAIEEVGFFDEQFFLYLEDMELCMRLRSKGYEIYLLPDARALHVGHHSVCQAPRALLKSRVAKLPNYLSDSKGPAVGFVAAVIVWLGLYIRVLLRALVFAIRRTDDSRQKFHRSLRLIRLGR